MSCDCSHVPSSLSKKIKEKKKRKIKRKEILNQEK